MTIATVEGGAEGGEAADIGGAARGSLLGKLGNFKSLMAKKPKEKAAA
jgi:hypothetical protein